MPSASPARTATPRAGGPQRAAPSDTPPRPPDSCSAASQPGLTAHCSRSSRSRCFCSPSAGWWSTSATYPRRGERPTGDSLATSSRSDTRRQGLGLSPPSPPTLPPSSLTAMTPQPPESTAATAPAVALIVRHPEGSIRVSTPTDVPLRELLPDLLE